MIPSTFKRGHRLASRHVLTVTLISTLLFGLDSMYAQNAELRLQGKIVSEIVQLKKENVFNKEYSLFIPSGSQDIRNEIRKTVTNYGILEINNTVKNDVLNSKPEYLKLKIPIENGVNFFTLLLYKSNISPNGFTLQTSDGSAPQDLGRIVHYRGCIENDNHSIVSMSFSDYETMGMFSNDEGNFVLGKIGNSRDGLFVLYNDKDLVKKYTYNCATSFSQPSNPPNKGSSNNMPLSAAKCINWYWEADNDIYIDKGSVANVNSYMQGIFNQVATLYANDSISISLQTLFVWNTADPYTGPSTSDYLNQFGTYRTSFNGDLAHLIGYYGGGGIAWIHGMCSSIISGRMAYSAVGASFSNVPTYSWTIDCIAHEEGHLLGSNHTHDCVWNGNNTAIDGCGPSSGYSGGSCPVIPLSVTTAAGGGTIMSYCHLNIGKNFNTGFGPQPRALMNYNVNSSSCLGSCVGCPTPAQPANITGSVNTCPGISQTYNISAVSGATSYSWILPVGWTGTSSTNSITVIPGSSGGTISVSATNSCGSGPSRTLSVSVLPIPAQAGSISGNVTVCQNSSQVYSVNAVSGATNYQWSLPSGWAGNSTTNSISVTVGNLGGSVSVIASNNCGSSSQKSVGVTISNSISQPGAITGSAVVCENSSQTYSVTPVNGATSYNWTLPPGWSGSSLSNSITAIAGNAGGVIAVNAVNSCGSSSPQTLNTTISGFVPSQPGIISGSATLCMNSVQTYSVGTVTGATSYSWNLPSGWSGNSSTNSIAVTSGNTSGIISVTANSNCGSSAARTLSATVLNTPSQPGTISGSGSVCQNSSQTYSIPLVSGATSYQWTLPSGWSGSSTTNSINVITGSTGGSITVQANNTCGSSNSQSKTITILGNIPVQPGVISGNTMVCQGTSQTYSISPVSGATGYSWSLPVGWTGASTSNSITVTTGANGGTLSVSAVNGCGISLARILQTTISGIVPAQPGTISGNPAVCQSSTQTYSVTAVTGASSYTWTLPSDWTGSSTTNTITVTTGTSGGTISVKANNTCGSSAVRSMQATISGSVPAQPGSISGSAVLCQGSSQTYSVSAVTGASSYLWTFPSGWSGVSTSNSISLIAGNAGGTLTVKAINTCGSSQVTTKNLTISGVIPAQPGQISGSSVICPSTIQIYSVVAVTGATSYIWSLPNGWGGTSTTNTITASAGNSSGIISVIATNSCGTSSAQTLAITSASAPAQPGVISGPSAVCENSSQTYTVAVVPGATSYIWKIPAGWSGSSTTNTLTVTTGTGGGKVTVKSSNSCGKSISRQLQVSISGTVPHQPGTISGTVAVCQNSIQQYTVAAVPGATGYIWTLPNGWTGSSTTNSITTTTGNAGGVISVKAYNNCGNSVNQTLPVTINGTTPSQPGTISGSAYVCESSVQTYSIPTVPGASNYTWTLPSGWTGVSTSNLINVIAGNTGGTISVKANNICGSSIPQTSPVTISGSVPSKPSPITGPVTVCGSSTQTYAVNTVAGATSYAWTLPSGWTGSSTSNTISVIIGANGGSISVIAKNNCGGSISQKLAVVISGSVPGQPASIIGTANVCAGSIQTYSTPVVAGATSYIWTLPGGWTGTSSTNSITLTTGANGGMLAVKAANNCGNSADQLLNIAVSSSPATPGTIIGTTFACQGSTQTYSINPVQGAISYTWTLPSGWSGVSITNSIAVIAGSSSGLVSVYANNSCGTSGIKTKFISISSIPAASTSISGNTSVCKKTAETYTASLVPGASSYIWTLPSGWTGSSTSRTITVTTGTSGGNISVRANNSCGTGVSKTIAVQLISNCSIIARQMNSSIDFTVYPNPANKKFTVTINNELINPRIEIFNSLGLVVYQEMISGNREFYKTNINLDAPEGIYFIKVTDGMKQQTQKLILSK